MTFKKIAEISANNGDARSFVPSDEYPLPSNKIGIEVEVEAPPDNIYDIARGGLWTAKGDNSLRVVNGLEPVELITLPVFGNDITRALDQLGKAFEGWDTDLLSHRTSLHVHLDVVDMDKEDLIKLLLLYTALERVLFRYCGKDREHNLYCLPYWKADHIKTMLYRTFEVLGEDDPARAHQRIGEWHKYSALNMRRILDLGTIEFRQHAGSVNPEEIKDWVKIILAIKKYAMTKVEEIDSFPTAVSGWVAREYLNDVFGYELADKLHYDGVEDDILLGVRTAQDVLIYKALDDLNGALFRENLYGKNSSSFYKLFKEKVDATALDLTNYEVFQPAGRGPTPIPRFNVPRGARGTAPPVPDEWTVTATQNPRGN